MPAEEEGQSPVRRGSAGRGSFTVRVQEETSARSHTKRKNEADRENALNHEKDKENVTDVHHLAKRKPVPHTLKANAKKETSVMTNTPEPVYSGREANANMETNVSFSIAMHPLVLTAQGRQQCLQAQQNQKDQGKSRDEEVAQAAIQVEIPTMMKFGLVESHSMLHRHLQVKQYHSRHLNLKSKSSPSRRKMC